MPKFSSEELKSKSPEELAILAERNEPLSSEGVLIKDEWQRRARIEQHKLDIALISRQVRWMKFSILAVIAAAIISSLLTYFLSRATESRFQEMMQQVPKQTTILSPLTSSPEMNRDHSPQKEGDDILDSSVSLKPPPKVKNE